MLSTIKRTWFHKGLQLIGNSVGGVGTSFVCPQFDVCLDLAQGLPFAFSASHFLVTHAHTDHASGLPYILSQRALMRLPLAKVYVPAAARPGLLTILEAWQELEKHSYSFELIGVEPDQEYPLGNKQFFRVFPTVHRVPSNGYALMQRKKKLKAEFQQLSGREIVELRRQGIEINEEYGETILSFTGDTQIEFLDLSPWVKQSQILVMEVTYFDHSKTVAHAREWGHIHWFELRERLSELSCEKLVLIHLSARYSVKEVEQIIKRDIGQDWAGRIEIFPRDG